MRYQIRRMGRPKLVIIITVVSVFLALLTDYTIAQTLNHTFLLQEDAIRAAIIPIIIAPFISWYLVGLIFELDRKERLMKKLATYDDLTSLLNRRAFNQACESVHKLSIRNKKSYSVLVVDLDYFKKINDKYGHAGGDVVLAKFGELAKEVSRDSDIIGRLGGEEFGFFLPNTNSEQAGIYTEKLRQKINSTCVKFEDQEIYFTASIGIDVNIDGAEPSLEKLLINADRALYRAKANGRNQCVIFNLFIL